MKLFVYGTLQRSFHNHYLIASGTFLRKDSLRGTLYTSSPHGRGIPFLLPGVGTVRGELYEIDESLLHRLDSLEGHPTWYTREVRKLDSGEDASVYAYNHPEQAERLYLAASGSYAPPSLRPQNVPMEAHS